MTINITLNIYSYDKVLTRFISLNLLNLFSSFCNKKLNFCLQNFYF